MFFRYLGILCADESNSKHFMLITKKLITYHLHFVKKIEPWLLQKMAYADVEVKGYVTRSTKKSRHILVSSIRLAPELSTKTFFGAPPVESFKEMYSETFHNTAILEEAI
ncbi:MAG: hypothetical protein ACOYOK_12125 [Pseudobdellovibrionaceae bacterium]